MKEQITPQIKTKQDIIEYITVCLQYQIGPADCAALSNAYDFAKKENIIKIIEIDHILFSMKLIKEIQEASKVRKTTFELLIELCSR